MKQPEALRLADALDSDLSAEWMHGITLKHISAELRRLHEENEALRARLAQPEQPQIVWIDNKQTGNFLNIAPPQREWIGLTDEELREFEIWLDEEEEKHGWNPPADIVKYIEAKLKEKNT